MWNWTKAALKGELIIFNQLAMTKVRGSDGSMVLILLVCIEFFLFHNSPLFFTIMSQVAQASLLFFHVKQMQKRPNRQTVVWLLTYKRTHLHRYKNRRVRIYENNFQAAHSLVPQLAAISWVHMQACLSYFPHLNIQTTSVWFSKWNKFTISINNFEWINCASFVSAHQRRQRILPHL